MASFSVYEPPETAPGSFEAADGSAFVKDGWCWPALLIPPIWLIWRRMWLVFLLWLAAVVAISLLAALTRLPEAAVSAVETGFWLWFALEANALRRWTLARHGWRFAGIATGVDRVDAEHRFFARHGLAAPVPVPPGAHGAAAAPARLAQPAAATGVIGVFPERWDGRP
jgi:hypothetical protein